MVTHASIRVTLSVGDLAQRKLLPALFQLERSNLLHPQTD